MNENETNVTEKDELDEVIEFQEAIDRGDYVSKAAMDELQAKYGKLYNAYTKREKLNTSDAKPKASIQELRNDLWGKDCGKLDSVQYVSKLLDLRDALIESGERDPALPVGDRVQTTSEHMERNEKIAEGLRSMLEFAEGDEGIFLAEYQRRVTDPVLPIGKKKR